MNLCLRLTELPLFPLLATESLASSALPPSSCAHMKLKDRKIISTVNWTGVRIFKRKKVFIIKVCNFESDGLFLIHHIFMFSICKTQENYFSWFTKRRNKNTSKLSKQRKGKQAG